MNNRRPLESDLHLREMARLEGASNYVSTRPCSYGHSPIRFTRDGKCVECNRIACSKRNERAVLNDPIRLEKRQTTLKEKTKNDAERKRSNKSGDILRAYGKARNEALQSGVKTYFGRPCKFHLSALRYSKSGGCVECTSMHTKVQNESGYYKRRYADADKTPIREAGRLRYEVNKEQCTERTKLWVKNNIDKRRVIVKRYKQKKRIESPAYILATRLASNIRLALKRISVVKKGKTVDALGCTYEEFRKHIEKQFTEGMSWERLSEIHIDHIIPAITANTEEEVIKLFHFTNLRPLWAVDNLRKSDKIGYIVGDASKDNGISFRRLKLSPKMVDNAANL